MTAARRSRLRERLMGDGLDALLVTAPVDLRWLTGLVASAGSLLVRADGDDLLVVDGRYAEQARTLEAVAVRVARGHDWLPDAAPDLGRIGVQSDVVTWDLARQLTARLGEERVVASSGVVATLRQRKDAAELATLRRACAITTAAFEDLLTWLAPDISERDVALRLDRAMVDRGADAPAFATIVASGPLGARPHHEPGARLLEAGDLVTCDFGARVDGYHADMTRTVALGTPDPRLAAAYAAVLSAQTAGVSRCVAGEPAAGVDAACRDRLADAGLAEFFAHPTGHGVGLEIHETPILRSGLPGTLEEHMTVTVEPGVYLPGLGGVRIEDVVAVDATPEVLTHATKTLLSL